MADLIGPRLPAIVALEDFCDNCGRYNAGAGQDCECQLGRVSVTAVSEEDDSDW